MLRRILLFLAVLSVPLSLAVVSALPASADESPPTLSPAQGPPGTHVTASATDWPGCSSMSVSGWGATLGTASINSSGAFSLPFTVPGSAPVGAVQLQFSPTCSHSTYIPFVTFTVTQGTPGTSVPAAPSNLTATAVDPHDIRLNWHDNSSNETGFEINNGVVSRNAGANSTTYTWGGLAPGTYMCFKIRAYNSAGDSAWDPNVSPWYVCTTTPKPTPKPKSCPTVLLGLHGMNEGPSSTKNADISSTVEATFIFFESMAAKAHKFRPNDYIVDDISYPTTGYFELDNPFKMRTIVSDVVDGSNALQAAVHKYTACGSSSKLELVGYSEGAWVIDYWLHFHQGEAKYVKAIMLYGDPNWYEAYGHDVFGSVAAYQGLARIAGLTFGWCGPPYPHPNAPYAVQTVCIPKDPVCGKGYVDTIAEHAVQFAAAAACQITNCSHLDVYYVTEGYTKRGAAFLAKYAF